MPLRDRVVHAEGVNEAEKVDQVGLYLDRKSVV